MKVLYYTSMRKRTRCRNVKNWVSLFSKYFHQHFFKIIVFFIFLESRIRAFIGTHLRAPSLSLLKKWSKNMDKKLLLQINEGIMLRYRLGKRYV